MDTLLFFGMALAYVALLAWGIALIVRRGRVSLADIPLLVILGLIYDNTLIASGRFIGEGPLLETLSLGRYWVHALVTPLLVVWAWHACRRSGARWAATRTAATAAAILAAALVVLEYVTVIAPLQLQPSVEYGVLTYSSADTPSGPPLMVLFVTAALLTAAITVWVKQRIWVLTGGTALMIIGSAVPIPVESAAVTNIFELILLTSILWTVTKQDAHDRTQHTVTR